MPAPACRLTFWIPSRITRYASCSAILPIYDGGNMGMQRRRVHGVLASPDFDPRALRNGDEVRFTKAMETIDTIQSHEGVGLAATR